MKNLIKLKVILVVFIIIFTTYSVVADEILPLPKPIIDEDKFIFAKNLEDAEAVTKRLGATLIGLYEIDKWK